MWILRFSFSVDIKLFYQGLQKVTNMYEYLLILAAAIGLQPLMNYYQNVG